MSYSNNNPHSFQQPPERRRSMLWTSNNNVNSLHLQQQQHQQQVYANYIQQQQPLLQPLLQQTPAPPAGILAQQQQQQQHFYSSSSPPHHPPLSPAVSAAAALPPPPLPVVPSAVHLEPLFLHETTTNSNIQNNPNTGTITNTTAVSDTAESYHHPLPQDLFLLDPPLLRSPLFSTDATVLLCPHLIDAIQTSLPKDAWDWESSMVFIPAAPKQELPRFDMADNKEKLQAIKLNMEKDSKGRAFVAYELFLTEINYVRDLDVLLNVYRKRLVDESIITEMSAKNIFSGLDDLYTMQRGFLDKFESLVSVGSWNEDTTPIGSLFIDYNEDFKAAYARFISAFSLSRKEMTNEEKNNPEYTRLLEELEKTKEVNRQSLKALLITPIQRTTRYSLLLKDLIKKTPNTHPDTANLLIALETMTALAKDVNDKKRQEEQQTGMFEAFESTKNCPPTFIKHSRKMVFKIDVYELKVVGGGSSDKSSSSVGGGGGAPSSSSPSAGMSYNATSGSGSIAIGASDRLVMGNKQYRLFLCNDVLMLTSHAKTPGVLGNIIGRGADVDKQYKYICLVPLTEVEVEDVPDHREAFRITFNTTGPRSKDMASGTSYLFKCDGFDGLKNRNAFCLTIKSETKICVEAELKSIYGTSSSNVNNSAGGFSYSTSSIPSMTNSLTNLSSVGSEVSDSESDVNIIAASNTAATAYSSSSSNSAPAAALANRKLRKFFGQDEAITTTATSSPSPDAASPPLSSSSSSVTSSSNKLTGAAGGGGGGVADSTANVDLTLQKLNINSSTSAASSTYTSAASSKRSSAIIPNNLLMSPSIIDEDGTMSLLTSSTHPSSQKLRKFFGQDETSLQQPYATTSHSVPSSRRESAKGPSSNSNNVSTTTSPTAADSPEPAPFSSMQKLRKFFGSENDVNAQTSTASISLAGDELLDPAILNNNRKLRKFFGSDEDALSARTSSSFESFGSGGSSSLRQQQQQQRSRRPSKDLLINPPPTVKE